MMKDRKAFTLIELLAVLTLIGILSAITVPIVSIAIGRSKVNLYKDQEKIILKGAISWAEANTSQLPSGDDNGVSNIALSIGLLKANGFLSTDLKNPKTGYLFPNDMIVNISYDDSVNEENKSNIKYNGHYKFELDENSGTKVELSTNIPTVSLDVCPSITTDMEDYEVEDCFAKNLNIIYEGYDPEEVKLEYYLDETQLAEVISYNYNGIPVETIDMTKYGFYYVYYNYSDETKTDAIATPLKIFMINDTEAPQLKFDEQYQTEYSIYDNVDLQNYVSCQDNSGQCKIKTSGSITPGVSGKYVITYYATDNIGNTFKQKQVITIK